jgi:hypothetical protein
MSQLHKDLNVNCQNHYRLQMPKVLISTFLFILAFYCSAQAQWTSITHKNGFHIQLPSYFREGLLVAAGTLQYYDNTIDSTISITVESFGMGTKEELNLEYEERKKSRKPSYYVLKPTWFVLSGTDEQGLYYQKTIITGGVMHNLFISYPADKQAKVDLFVRRAAQSFH